MMPSATEGTTQVNSIRVAGIGQEFDPAVSAMGQTRAQLRLGLQNRLQRGAILTDERVGAVILVPIRAKKENFLYRQNKKARLSITMAIVLCTPSSYRLDAKASRGRARFFIARRVKSATKIRAIHPCHDQRLARCPNSPTPEFHSPEISNALLGKKEAHSPLSKQWVNSAEQPRVNSAERYSTLPAR
jgi:hypothetical protein